MELIIVYLLILIVPAIASANISSTYAKYKKIDNSKGISGLEVAKKILENNGLGDMYVVETPGNLTDHYDPSKKVIRLSSDVFHGNSIGAAAVAAHECGHAVQDKEGYSWYRMRHSLVPFVNLVTYSAYILFAISIFLQIFDFLVISVILVLAGLLFQIVTLPVEFDASRRGLDFLVKYGLLDSKENSKAKKVLTAAALTYVASVISSLLNLVRLLLIYGRRRD